MIVPIVAYGDPVLRKKTVNLTPEYPNFKELIQNMMDTMYGAYGVGLAAPQIGLALRLFVIDASPFAEDEDLSEEEQKELQGFKKVFVNPIILEESGNEWGF